MLDNTARMIGTVGIWIAYAIIMAFGLCRMSFSGVDGAPVFVISVIVISVATVIATRIVWRNAPR